MVELQPVDTVIPGKSCGPMTETTTNRKKLKTAGGRSKGVRSSSTTTCDVTKLIVVIITILILVSALIAVVLVIVMDQMSSSLRAFEKASCDEVEPTPMHINSCLNSNCRFDLSTCFEPCPFGYRTDESGCEDSCECAIEGSFEGDIAFSEDEIPKLTELYGYSMPGDFDVFSGSSTTGRIWNDKPVDERHKIYYEWASSVTEKAEKAIIEAIKRYEEKTCIDFIERKTEERYFRFTSGRGCMSMIGRHRKNGQQVSIGKGCEIPGVVQHELLHLLGFHHEHSRPDRDSYLKVLEENILKERFGNFKKRLKSQVRDLDSEYDITSVMHYPSNAFSKNKKPTILNRKNDKLVKAQRRGFTNEDLYEVNLLYNCYNELAAAGSKFQRIACQGPPCPRKAGRWSEWGSFTECSEKCSGGFQWRRRRCSAYGECEGVSYQGQSCNKEVCEGMPRWAEWSAWSTCSNRCGGGSMSRKRQCLTVDFVAALTCEGDDATGVETQRKDCNTNDCGGISIESDYENLWSSCSSSCEGTKTRERICEGSCPPGQNIEKQPCNVGACDGPRPEMYLTDVVQMPQVLCNPSARNRWYFGDFNGDKRTDALCMSDKEFFKLAHTSPDGAPIKLNWQGYLRECTGWFRFIGDFNGDGRDDVLCRDDQSRKLTIKFANKDGQFDDLELNVGNFCTQPADRIFIADVNGDGKADLICRYANVDIEIRLNRI
ncbi:uncharacterized protein LOC120346512 isoform X2 [Styela clava]